MSVASLQSAFIASARRDPGKAAVVEPEMAIASEAIRPPTRASGMRDAMSVVTMVCETGIQPDLYTITMNDV